MKHQHQRPAARFRLIPWGNIKTEAVSYGIQILPKGQKKFLHIFQEMDGVKRPLIYTTEARAEEIMKLMRAGKQVTDWKTGLLIDDPIQ